MNFFESQPLSACGDLRALSRVKVFGERNCGTKFLVQAFEMNTSGLQSLVHGDQQPALDAVKGQPFWTRKVLLERAIDDLRMREFPHNFGWKHAALRRQQLQDVAAFSDTLFVCIVRNPYAFVDSLYQRPYNLYAKRSRTRAAFCREPIFLNARDNLACGIVSGPAELWTRKVRSYLELSDLSNLVVVRYEDVVSRFAELFEFLRGAGIQVCDSPSPPAKSTNNDSMTFEDYLDKARQFDAEQVFEAAELECLRPGLDPEVCSALGYQRL